MARPTQWPDARTDAATTASSASPRRRVSILDSEQITYVDYKDVNLLRRFMSERAKIRARRVTGNDTQQQREVARAIRVAREMALLPYSVRQVTHRSKGRRGDRGDREGPLRMPTRRAGARRPTRRRRPPPTSTSRRSTRRRRARRLPRSRPTVGERRGRDAEVAESTTRRPTTVAPKRRGGRRMKIVLRDDVENLGQQGRRRRRRRRLRAQLPRAARPGDEGDEGRRRPGRGHAAQPRRTRTCATRGRRGAQAAQLERRAVDDHGPRG